ncbi:phosphoglycerate mutase [Comamonas antarctica]|uniref:Phosphoglycerate mutase n=1 Tax=Comamonas antarctica TaxID=2743470 RepID=A0A6N1X3V1_9BURK|nr:phosphoglycerate mutase [Comamonas antarctica]QKV54144.1 phosphoglycerate mutase [Comamonas antarctica]
MPATASASASAPPAADLAQTVAFATAGPEAAALWPTLQLPHLRQLLQHAALVHSDAGEETDFCPPHERAWARRLQLPLQAGCVPWAAWEQQAADPAPQQQAWAWLSPCHWRIGADTVHMADPAGLGLEESESRALLEILAPWFAEDGIALQFERPDRWLASGAPLDGLATASLDRVVGRDVRRWLPDARTARTLNRLHSEVQMLLYTHAFNDRRAARGLAPVNAFWLHGAGRLEAHVDVQPLRVHPELAALRAAALQENWPAWAAAWQQLDAGLLRELLEAQQRGAAVQLTLCGERNALTWQPQAPGWRQKIQQVFKPAGLPDLPSLL